MTGVPDLYRDATIFLREGQFPLHAR
jgi:hypothetical protein